MRNGINMISVWFGGVMIVVVVGLAIAFAFTDLMDDRLYGNKRIGFIILLLAYAIYRGFRMRQLLRSEKSNEA